MKPDLSIIIPCYNCFDTLEETVESCYFQGLDNFEIVMVDDGSTDGTRTMMQKLAEKHPEIKLFYHDKNKGGGVTRNTAVKNSKGDVIFCLDSDDVLPENTLSRMLAFMKEKNCDGVGVHRSIKFRGENINDIVVVHVFGYVGEKIPLESLLQKNDVYCSLYSTFMITKKAFDAIGGYPEYHGFDTQGLAWRFLVGGFTAYTCPDAAYLHRIEYKKSYYLREAEAGKANYNWQDVLSEFIFLFDNETQKFILDFDCKDFSRSLFEEFKKRDHIFKKNYLELLGTPRVQEKIHNPKRVIIKRMSIRGFIIRIKGRLKNNRVLYSFAVYIYALLKRLKKLFSEGESRKEYYKQIEKIKKEKKIILDLSFGGIGDCLAFSTLPRLSKEAYDINFYLSKKSLEVLRQKDTLKLCFELNPYFKGLSDDRNTFKPQFFEREKSIYTFLTDKEGENVIETMERQFGLKGKGVPELCYKPNTLEQYKHIVLVDENTISGKKFGWMFKDGVFHKEAMKHCDKDDKIEYADPSKQDLFTYVDMIYSCKHFVGTFSGGASIAACFKKPFSVLWPHNAINGSNYQFRYKNGAGVYVK